MTDFDSLRDRIDAIEEGYELLLAYAAQGRQTDQGSGQDIRTFLANMDKAMEGLGELCLEVANHKDQENVSQYQGFLDAVKDDAVKAQGLVRLILVQENISSQLIDNLNANVYLRTLLTDLFIIDDIFCS